MSNKLNYKLNKLDKASSTCTDIVNWYKDITDESILKDAEKLKTKLLRLSNKAKAAHDVLPVATTIGVFGASQAGKSYLVSALASNGGGAGLETNWNGKKISFFSHLNPTGGNREATGIVTRFTSNSKVVVEDYPITLKLLTEAEYIKILVNSYFLDINFDSDDGKKYLLEHDAFFKDENNIKAHFKALNDPKYLLKAGESSYFTKADIVSLADYVNTHSNVSCLKEPEFNADGLFFTQARNIIEKLNKDGRLKLFSVLWHDMPAFNNLYKSVIDDFDKLQGATVVYANTDAIVVPCDDGSFKQRPTGTVVDVQALSDILNPADTQTVDVCIDAKANTVVSVRHSVLSAATCELEFPQAQNSGVKACDVLDFPGARSREKMDTLQWRTLSGIPKNKDDTLTAVQFLLRGKVGYLIERYCERHEIDVLLCCQSVEGQAEVSELTPYITNWVNSNVGSTPKARSGRVNPLVGVFTKFDFCITRDFNKGKNVKTDSDIGKTITIAMQKFKTEWVTNWTDDNVFDQFFFARRPNLENSKDVYDVIRDENDDILETKINADATSKIEEYKKEIIKDPCMKYIYKFSEYEKQGKAIETPVISEVLKPADGGVSYLVKFINDTYGNDFTQGKDTFYQTIMDAYTEIEASLSKYVSRDSSKQREKNKQEAKARVNEILQCDALAGTLADLRSFIEIDAKDAKEDYLVNYEGGVNTNSYRFANALTKMRDAKLDDMTQGLAFENITNNILNAWNEKAMANVLSKPLEQRVQENSFFLDSNNEIIKDKAVLKEKIIALLNYFTHEMKVSYKAMKVEQSVAIALEKQESPTARKEDLVDSQCEIALKIISDFNTYLCVGQAPNMLSREIGDEDPDRALFSENFVHNFEPVITKNMVSKIKNHYASDHFSVLVHLITNVNSQATSLYELSAKQNDDLCAYLQALEDNITVLEG